MGKKKQEMSQIYNSSNNEFIFGENGGKGKHLSSFLKNLSLTGSSLTSNSSSTSSNNNSKHKTSSKDDINEVNSNIYGNLSYGYVSPKANSGSIYNETNGGGSKRNTPSQRSVSGPVGASFSHVGSTPPPEIPLNRSTSNYSIQKNQRRSPSHGRHKYTDLDDDWDADLDDVTISNSSHKNSVENKNLTKITGQGFGSNNSSRSSLHLQPSPMLDSLYPDLTMPVTNSPNNANKAPKESLDYEDYQMKLEINRLNQLNSKYSKFKKILTNDNNINIQDLRKLSWNGIPPELRAITWQVLLGYLPTNRARQSSTLKRKRQEYWDGLSAIDSQIEDLTQTANSSTVSLDQPSSTNNNNSLNRDKQLYHQIKIDVKRTNPSIKLYGYDETQKSLRKILYLWAVRHPASGYVQGINDLCTPFYQIFLHNYIWQLQRAKLSQLSKDNTNEDDDFQLFIPGLLDPEDEQEQELLNDSKLMQYNLDNFDPSKLSTRVSSIIEADTYWCLSRLLENITDNYIHEQPGIIRQVNDLRNLISKIDLELLQHFDQEGIEFIQFSFRWMNCLLMRELSINLIIRMWDTYLSETPLGFNNFHIYVCAAFLIKFSNELKEKDFQEILLFLQNPPTSHWKEKDVELMLSEAFIWQSLYKNASAHLR